jgi:hypothetical protein
MVTLDRIGLRIYLQEASLIENNSLFVDNCGVLRWRDRTSYNYIYLDIY